MLTDFERKELSEQIASVRDKMNFICDLLNVELMETSILADLDSKHEREQVLATKIRDLKKVTEYYIMNHKLLPFKSRESKRADEIR